MKRMSVSLVLLGLFAAGCGGAKAGDGPKDGGAVPHPVGAKLVLRIENTGGFLPATTVFREIPAFSLYGDGRIFTAGPQIEIFPPPALPAVQVTTITEAGVQAILAAAGGAGLYLSDRKYPVPRGVAVADAGTTTFTVFARGKRHVISADALGTVQETGARAALSAFRDRLGDLRRLLPAGSITGEKVYEPTGLRVVIVPPGVADQGLQGQPAKAWPVPGQLATFQQKVAFDARCGTVTGAAFPKVLLAVQTSNTLTRWIDGGRMHQLAIRPLLPEETTC